VGSALIILIGVQVVRVLPALARGRADRGFGTLFTPRDALYKRLGMLAITIVFVALVPYLGLALGLFLALSVAFYLMGIRGIPRVLVVSLAVSIASSLLFTVALDSGLPKGPVENLIGRLAH
jgi:ABC-type sugar transport system permease subunit